MRPIRTSIGVALATLAALGPAVPSSMAASEPKAHFGTGGVSHVSGTTAELEGTVNTEGLPTKYFFEYGPTVAYGAKSKEVTVPIPAPLKPVKVGQTVTGILAGYHYRIVGFYTDLKGVTHGPLFGTDRSFSGGKAGKLKFIVAKGREEAVSAVYGSTLSLTGSLTGVGNTGKALSLQATPFPFTAPFTTLPGTVLSTRTGSFTFKVARITQNTEFRFIALSPRPVYSPVVPVTVTPRITVHVRSAGGTGLYRIYGTVAPAKPGAQVVIQQLTPQRAGSKRSGPRPRSVGSTVLKRAGASLSRYSAIVSLSGTFRYRVFVRLPKGAVSSGHSSNVLIKAPKETTKKKKGH
ncbi:MAG TPA: hypothetical protein VN618_09830 [Solirubrobacteraceae bacterium]|nr:hypothetical protein [Solirubrobacteraceae bacterium]